MVPSKWQQQHARDFKREPRVKNTLGECNLADERTRIHKRETWNPVLKTRFNQVCFALSGYKTPATWYWFGDVCNSNAKVQTCLYPCASKTRSPTGRSMSGSFETLSRLCQSCGGIGEHNMDCHGIFKTFACFHKESCLDSNLGKR